MINILVALNANYLYPLKVMLNSLFVNNPEEKFTVFMMHSKLTKEECSDVKAFVVHEHHRLVAVYVDPDIFHHAAVFRHFSSEMYYRLIAYRYLPETVDRVLYLDPDIIVLNSVANFYHRPFDNAFFIACEHEYSAKVAGPFNKIRLKIPKAKGYFNTGVLLMNIERLKKIDPMQETVSFIRKHRHLLLPDQDIFNALYWDKIIPVPGVYYNYDARYYELSKLLPTNKSAASLQWIRTHTVFIHYCGKQKPWQKTYKGDLGVFFRRYAKGVAGRTGNMMDACPSES